MTLCFLADGFEEAEALVPVDLLRRAGVKVLLVGVGDRSVCGSHGISVTCDIRIQELDPDHLPEPVEMILLPGGMPGTENLYQSSLVRQWVKDAFAGGLWVGAICAAPSIPGRMGLLEGRRATCYPGFESYLTNAQYTGSFLECDGRLVTAKGMGVAHEFGLKLIECLKGSEAAAQIKAAAMCR